MVASPQRGATGRWAGPGGAGRARLSGVGWASGSESRYNCSLREDLSPRFRRGQREGFKADGEQVGTVFVL